MRNNFKVGDTKSITHVVDESDLAVFETGMVHAFYATFALGRDAEWASRQFVLEMLENDEEGIGTYLTIDHHAPALLGEMVEITARIEEIHGNSIHCTYEAFAGERKIASGKTGQKILKKEKVNQLIKKITGG